MSDIKVATRYAKSLLDLAIEKGKLEAIKEDMQKLHTIADQNRDFVLILRNPIVNTDKKNNVLKSLFGKSADPITMRFFDLVTSKNRADVLVQTANEFQRQYNQYKGIQVAELTTTFPLSDKLKKEIVDIVKEISGLDTVELVEKIDKDLIGGFILKVNDKRLDESLSGKLRDLRLKFAQKYYEKLY
ncbi:ATP synthase F1 subunit delta [Pararhodonellum marinum]|uniref:ATP synthase F1 subunit delta n=1 Tax=Pararhodonellum marinum TaxID=2755358 RepID=UPI00188E4A3A|nr:ATP synthase F1 subunit delta [Pararhodonellum marinum]